METVQHLRRYRVNLLDNDNQVRATAVVFCHSDDEACVQARRGLQPSERTEVWDSGRLVTRGNALENGDS